jgi:carbamoyltransferase
MGLAPYGEPKYKKLIYDHLIDVKNDGSFRMNMEYFNYCAGLTMTNNKFNKLFGGPPRVPETKLSQKDMDLARSLQEVTEEIVMKMGNHVHKETGQKNLTLAGGVALNCVANGKLLKEGPFENIWIQPAAGDAGGALGAALVAWYNYLGNPRTVDGNADSQLGSYLGPSFNDEEIRSLVQSHNYPAKKLDEDELIKTVSKLIAEEKVIGWFDGRMEFGPRALGARTIIGDARSPKMQALMNIKIKFREGFRPFAPSVLYEKVGEYFEIEKESPYMLLVADVKKERRIKMTDDEEKLWGIDKLNIVRSDIPAITHVDYSARLQTVHKKTNPRYHKLIEQFEKDTGCAVIINTSFNVRGEPIVCTPEDAYKCFMRTNMDYLVLGNYLLSKEDQKPLEKDVDWKKEFALD